ncbi:hypothetical protein [Nodosilinea sp. P-1105]|uniref:hypothetical protein n=1 Tax=Nodosilinea sp. P-1105 TaxID=2546229 RepID=UPI00146EA761|nr:hypothetical protein [Nodosilinea sp. P-1105]
MACHSLILGQRIAQHLVPAPSTQPPTHETLASIARHRWTPPSGTPTVVEMLRADRDR